MWPIRAFAPRTVLPSEQRANLSQTRYGSFTSVRAGSQEEIPELQNEKAMRSRKIFCG
jgi:hypothetical protein